MLYSDHKLALRARNIVPSTHRFCNEELTKADVRYDSDREKVPSPVRLISETKVDKADYSSYYTIRAIERGEAKHLEYTTEVPNDSEGVQRP